MYTSPADKLARQILKCAEQRPGRSAVSIAIVIDWGLGDRNGDTIALALSHAVREGWMVKEGDDFQITPEGKQIGRHTRAGIRKKRRFS